MVDGQSVIFHSRHMFLVEIGGIERATFSTCSELSQEIEMMEHREGGRLIPFKQAGLITYPDITLERGSTKDHDIYDWAQQCANAAANSGLVTPDYKRTIDISQMNRTRKVVMRYRVHNAFITKHVGGDWDGTSSEAVIESITLTFDYFERIDL